MKYNTGALVRALRERIGLEREAVLGFSLIDESSLRRIEADKLNPTLETLGTLIEAVNIPTSNFIYSKLENQSMYLFHACDQLSKSLDIGDVATAEELVAMLEISRGFDRGIPLQFILSKKARLWELQNKPPEQILQLIEEGMRITFDAYGTSNFVNTALLIEEVELLHTKAKVFAKSGKINLSIKILEQMISNISKLPRTDRDKEKQYAPLLLSLATFLLQIGDYNEALLVCAKGTKFSAIHAQGQLNPEFEAVRARALLALHRKNECKAPLQHAYFGYMLLGDTVKAEHILRMAECEFDITFELYGVNELDIQKHTSMPHSYNHIDAIKCDDLGTMITALRKKANLSFGQLSCGICSKSTLHRIESNTVQASYFTIESIMQRLGRNVDLYKNYFLSKDDFIALQLRSRIHLSITEKKLDETSILLHEFETLKAVKHSSVLQQHAKFAKAILSNYEQLEPHHDYSNMLIDAIKITCPQFNENDIEQYHLTLTEMSIINAYAGYYGSMGDLERSLRIYDGLYRNIKGKQLDDDEKSKIISSVLFNYSTILSRFEQFQHALAVIDEGENYMKHRMQLIRLPNFAYNKGYNLFHLGKETESIPYHAMAYYGASIFAKCGQKSNLKVIRQKVKERFDIVFD